MKTKKLSRNFVFVFIFLAFALFVFPNLLSVKSEEKEGLEVLLFDKNKNPITKKLFAIVDGTPEVAYIQLRLSIQNTGQEIITCRINDLLTSGGNGNALIFKNSMTQCSYFPCLDDERTLNLDNFASWTTDYIATNPLVDESPWVFEGRAECFSNIGMGPQTLSEKSSQISFSILEEGSQGICGNQIKEVGEDCDGDDLGNASCVSEGFFTGTLDCNPGCTFDTSGCRNTVCGDGVQEGLEVCDDPHYGGLTCDDFTGFGSSGSLACINNCNTIDASGCVPLFLFPCASYGGEGCEPGEDCFGGYFRDSSDFGWLCCAGGGSCGVYEGKKVIFRTGVTDCTENAWSSGGLGGQWITYDVDENPATGLYGYGLFSAIDEGHSPNKPFLSDPCNYGIYYDNPNGEFFVLNVGDGVKDVGFDTFYYSESNPEYLSIIPCCGVSCGTCCERYDDGTSLCSPQLQTCSQLGGNVCTSEQTCEGGSFEDTSDYGTGTFATCCVSGTCTDPPAVCGDGDVEGAEECDGLNLDGFTCETIGQGFNTGNLQCYPQGHAQECTFDTSNCYVTPLKVVFRSNIGSCSLSNWQTGWFTIDYDQTPGNNLIGYGYDNTGTTSTSPDIPYITSPCDYQLKSFFGGLGIYVLNAGGTYDPLYAKSKYTQTNPEYLSESPCCGVSCGTCCERYDDGTSNC